MIRFAQEADKQAVRALFDTCFPEDLQFNAHFFEHCYRADQTLLYTQDDILCAMTQLLPYEMKLQGKRVPVTYIYGACTAPQARKKGYMAQLLEYSFQWDKQHAKVASVLIPQEQWLFGFYEKFGYHDAFSIAQTEIICANKAATTPAIRRCVPTDIQALQRCYEASLQTQPCMLLRTQAQWEQQLQLFDALGAGVYGIWEGQLLQAYAFLWDGELLWAQEFVATSQVAQQTLIAGICAQFSCDKLRVTTAGAQQVLGVAKYYEKHTTTQGYLNLMFN